MILFNLAMAHVVLGKYLEPEIMESVAQALPMIQWLLVSENKYIEIRSVLR